MKKLSLVAIFLSMLCVWPTAATARGLQKGDQLVSVFAGGAAPLQDAGIYSADIFGDDFANQELSWGEGAVSYGLQYMYALSPSWALGAEYNGSLFQEASYNSSYFLDEVYWGFNEIKTKMTVQNFLLAGRYTINPQGRIRFYIPLGVGLASASAKITASETICSGGLSIKDRNLSAKEALLFSII